MPESSSTTLLPVTTPAIIGPGNRESLADWFQLYGALEAGVNAGNTFQAKGRDLKLFSDFFASAVRSDHPDQWTKSVTSAFLRHLEAVRGMKPTTVNRVLATLRHCASWIERHRPTVLFSQRAHKKAGVSAFIGMPSLPDCREASRLMPQLWTS